VWPVDQIVSAYNLLLAFVWLGSWPQAEYAIWVAAAHAGASLLPLLIRRSPRPLTAVPRALRQLYPILFIPVFWTEIDLLFPLRHTGTFDQVVLGLDERLFGIQLAAEWMPRMPQVWFSEVMHFSYFAYYATIYIPPIAVVLAGRTRAARDMIFRLMIAYLSCYLVYISFPVDGPHFLLEPYQGDLQGGVFYQLVTAAQGSGDSRGCAFPSSHVVGAVTIAFLAWRWLSKPVAVLLTVQALGVVCSTIYTQSHYAADAVSGVTWALAVQLLLAPFLLRRLRPSTNRGGSLGATGMEPVPVPVLWTEGHGGRR
jgi:membrane-associated phospholipid phosphatase